MFVVSFLPNAPRRHNKFFKQHGRGVVCLLVFNSLHPIPERFPVDIQGSLASLTKRARENHVLHCFLDVAPTQQTVVVITDVVVASFQHIPGVQPVVEEKPCKDFQLHSTFRSPQPVKNFMSVDLPKVEMVVVR